MDTTLWYCQFIEIWVYARICVTCSSLALAIWLTIKLTSTIFLIPHYIARVCKYCYECWCLRRVDTYTAMEIDSFGHFYLKAKTAVLTNTQSPVWNESFEIDLEAASTLRLICYQKTSHTGDVLLGKCPLNVRSTISDVVRSENTC